MPPFRINEEKCTCCHFCVEACPLGLVKMDTASSHPHPTRGALRFCIKCGHCLAVCPRGALEHKLLPLADSPALHRGWRLAIEQVEPFLKGRRSIRAFRDKPVDRALIEKALDLARYAPSGTNAQPVKWTILYQRSAVERVSRAVMAWVRECKEAPVNPLGGYADYLLRAWQAGEDPICRKAPHLGVVYGAPGPVVDAACVVALTYFELAALPLGIGTCWAGFVQVAAAHSAAVREAIALPEGSECHGGVMMGHPRYEYRRIPPRKAAQVTWR